MSKKRAKKGNSTTSKGASMSDSVGRVTYGAGYEGDDRATGSEETVQGAAAEAVDATKDAAAATAGAVSTAASTAVDATQDAVAATAEAVADTAGAVVDTAQDAVAATAGAVQQVASTVVDTAQQATSTVTNAVAEKVDQVTDAAAGGVEQLADTVVSAAYGNDVSQGTRAVADTTVNVLDRTAEYLRNGDLSIVVEDLRDVVRRHPLRSIILGLGLGYLARGAFFPASASTTTSRPSGGVPPMPMSQSIPVYSGTSYDTGSDIGYGAYAGTSDIDVMSTVPLEDDILAVDTIGIGDELTDLDTIGMSSNQGSLASDTLGLGDDLTSLDTAGMRSDSTSSFGTGSATTLMDTGSTGAMLDSDLAASTTIGADASDELGVDAIDLGTTGQSGASGDLSTSSTSSTMPTEDQLRQWDSSSSGQNS